MLAVAGGLMIVPSFAAIQAWAAPERRARIVAAVNVLNAAFMVGGALVVALLQNAGVGIPLLFLGIAAVGLLAALWIGKTMPTNAFRDFVSILLRAFYRLEVKGLENLDKAGANAIIALNHVSFLDGAVALSILNKEPIFAVDHGYRPALVGKASPQADARDAARSRPAPGDADAHSRGQKRRDIGDLSGGAHHGHRPADEGV